ncbi:GlxA family transcriptional regulator [Streptomyces sp. BPTC-684]|uniref:GlxA family transcriptional regulator n=1 Tax=Streptomyces sp. BPTC-684 TaxID=3043734 RepID=UPI0024B2091D|nr:GlxA family transcriptional regulator [Streptomyces sp. BPTC-684]WHM40920.1 GlxA family transcriptional regulator [Streptomyces sp. BPTC-684]
MGTTPRRVVVIGYERTELLDIAGVTDTLDTANQLGAQPPYEVRLATVGGRPLPCSSGLTLVGQTALERVRGPLDTLVVSGGPGHEAAARDPDLLDAVRRLAPKSRRVASVCTGATVLAAAGLLDGRRAATHWGAAADLAANYPRVKVDPAPLYIRDGDIWTSAGVTGALDLTLALVEDDHGPDLARTAARTLVTYLHRPGNQAQISMFVRAPSGENPVVRTVIQHVAGHLNGDLDTSVLAALAGVSERHLARLCQEHLGQSPARFVRATRAEAAAQLLVSTALPIAAIARQCGFRTPETLRQAFLVHYGSTPSEHRARHSHRR